MRASGIAVLLVLSLLACSSPVVAGGWAMVRLDTTPGEVVVGVPWKFGFMVRQHDVTPISDVEPVITAHHQATGDVITATAQQEGPVGHFVAEMTFPRAGNWKWEIRPEPFAETAFAVLAVIDRAGASEISYPARLYAGSCAALGNVTAPLSEVAISPLAVKSTPAPVAVGVSTIDASLLDLIDSAYAIRVDGPDDASAPLACADVVPTEAQDQIDIVNDTSFAPSLLEISPGTTIIWTNKSEVAHTVTGDALDFDDSGIIDPGQSFSYTFTEPGTYAYHCSPHPYMTGVVVVS